MSRAISEYAPGATIVANSKVHTSEALLIYPDIQEFEIFYYRFCKNCHWFKYSRNIHEIEAIRRCETTGCGNIFEMRPEMALYPKWGFAVPKDSDKSDWVTRSTRLERAGYANELYLDEKSFFPRQDRIIKFKNNFEVHFELVGGYQLARINRSLFSICKRCGRQVLRVGNRSHRTPFSKGSKINCNSTTFYDNHNLISLFDTDVLRISFINCPPVPPGIIPNSFQWRSFWRSVIYCLTEAISRVLDIERNDIDCIFLPDKHALAKLVILDDVSGGAGHVSRLLGNGGENSVQLLNSILIVANEIANCKFCSPETACYSCLFHHKNQNVQHTLSRGLVLNWLAQIV